MQDVDPAAGAGFVQGRVPRVVVVVHVTALLLQAVQHHILHGESTAVTASPGGAQGTRMRRAQDSPCSPGELLAAGASPLRSCSQSAAELREERSGPGMAQGNSPGWPDGTYKVCTSPGASSESTFWAGCSSLSPGKERNTTPWPMWPRLMGVPLSLFSPHVFPSSLQSIPSPRHRSLPGVWFYICVFLMVSPALLGQESCRSAPGRSHSESPCVLGISGGMGIACSSAAALCLCPSLTPSASGAYNLKERCE